MFITAAGFASDAMTVGNALTINAGLRFDHSRAVSQDLPVLDGLGQAILHVEPVVAAAGNHSETDERWADNSESRATDVSHRAF